MRNEGIITLVCIVHEEALEVKKLLEETKSYKVEYVLVREQLYEIPETDENQYGNQNATGGDKIQEYNMHQDMSDGLNSSQNRHSPITQKGIHAGR